MVKLTIRHRGVATGDTITLADSTYTLKSVPLDEFPQYFSDLAKSFRDRGFTVKTRLYTKQALITFNIE